MATFRVPSPGRRDFMFCWRSDVAEEQAGEAGRVADCVLSVVSKLHHRSRICHHGYAKFGFKVAPSGPKVDVFA